MFLGDEDKATTLRLSDEMILPVYLIKAYSRKPKRCPLCKCGDVRAIMVGLSTEDMERKYACIGCEPLIETRGPDGARPYWMCMDCKVVLYKKIEIVIGDRVMLWD